MSRSLCPRVSPEMIILMMHTATIGIVGFSRYSIYKTVRKVGIAALRMFKKWRDALANLFACTRGLLFYATLLCKLPSLAKT